MTETIVVTAVDPSQQRRSKVSKQRPRRRGDRIAPEGMSTNAGTRPNRKRIKDKKKDLSVETTPAKNGDVDASTPRTEASVSCGSVRSTPSVRSKSDIRSPGQRKTPLAAEAPTPDFITQTDKNGNAVTPRSAAAIQDAKQPENNPEEDQLEVCAETLLDTFRLMCCCLVPEDTPTQQKKSVATHTVQSAVIEERPTTGLLPKLHPADHGKQCLVLDLDETLVHSSFRAVPGADFVIPVQIEDVVHFVYVMKRPGVDEFLVEMAKHYEIVIYTASLNKYADPLLDLLDPHNTIRSRLFRESCVYYEGNYVKDLSLLDRDLSQTIIVDNSPNSYIFHPENAIDCSSFIDDPKDRELDQIGAFLTGVKDVKDIRGIAPQWREWPNVPLEDQ